jgi:hypothetical protein
MLNIVADVRKIPVCVTVKGVTKKMFIQELDAQQADDWADYEDQRRGGSNDNNTNLKFKANLISRMLYDDNTMVKVPVEEIITWSSSAQQLLWVECQRLNAFTMAGIEEAKKLSQTTNASGSESPKS